jgi:hypothetical protein
MVTHASTVTSAPWREFPAITCMKSYTHQADPSSLGGAWFETTSQQSVSCPIEHSSTVSVSTISGAWFDSYKDSANNGISVSACTHDYTSIMTICGAPTTQTVNGYQWVGISDLSAWNSVNAYVGWHYVFVLMPSWSRFNGFELDY